MPDVAMPDVAMPDVAMPDVAMPWVTIPGVGTAGGAEATGAGAAGTGTTGAGAGAVCAGAACASAACASVCARAPRGEPGATVPNTKAANMIPITARRIKLFSSPRSDRPPAVTVSRHHYKASAGERLSSVAQSFAHGSGQATLVSHPRVRNTQQCKRTGSAGGRASALLYGSDRSVHSAAAALAPLRCRCALPFALPVSRCRCCAAGIALPVLR